MIHPAHRGSHRRVAVLWAATATVPVLFFALFFLWPVAAIVARGINLNSLTGLADARLAGILWFTLWQAMVSTALTVVLGLGGAWTLARYRIPGRSAIRAVMTVPFVLPTVVVGAAFVALLGPAGPLAALHLQPSLLAVIAAHVFFNYAVVVRTVGGVLDHLDPRIEDAARVLGAGRWRAARSVTLPLLRPALAASTLIVFLFTFTSFGVVLILGGPQRSTLEVEIWRQTTQLLDLSTAAGLSLVQLTAVVATLALHARLTTRLLPAAGPRARREVARQPRAIGERFFVAANLGLAAVLLLTPLAVLAGRAFHTPTGWGLGFYRALGDNRRGSVLFVPPTEALRNSLGFAVATTLLALFIGGCAAVSIAYRRRPTARILDALLMLPLGTSAVTLGFGFLISLDRPPLDLRTSPLLIPIAHTIVAVPFVIRSVVPAARGVPERLREAARVLGATPRQVSWAIDVPIVSRAALVGAGLAFAVSLGEFGATVFIARPDLPTMPVAIFRLLSQPGALNLGQAMAMSTVLMAITAVAVLLIERFRAGAVGSF